MTSLATFNVKDLLDPGHAEKLSWIAEMLARVDADVVGLQEVGPPEALDAVLARLPSRLGYGAPIVGTADRRGIRCAILSRLPVRAARVLTAPALPFPVFREGDPPPFGDRIPLRRGVPWARLDAGALGTIDVLVCHFKSGRPVPLHDAAGLAIAPRSAAEHAAGMMRALVARSAEALYVRAQVDALLSDPQRGEAAGRHVVVLGDLNDVATSVPVQLLRGGGDGALFDCTDGAPAGARRSVIFERGPAQIDHVLATAGLYGLVAEARFFDADLRRHPYDPLAAEPPPTVDSDHAPVKVTIAPPRS